MYISYVVACTLFNILPLKFRRLQLCTNCVIKLFKSDRSIEYFTPALKIANTRNEQQLLVKEKKSNTKRCYNAPNNYLARLVNANKKKLEKMSWTGQNDKHLFQLSNTHVTCGLRGHAQLSVLLQTLLRHKIIMHASSPHVFIWNKPLIYNI